MSRISILIGFTPFHLLPLLKVLDAVEGPTYLFHPMAAHPRLDPVRDRITFLGRCDDPRVPRLLRYTGAGQSIRRMLRRSVRADVYVPHPFNPLANFAFFHPHTAARYIYQDGILGYRDVDSPLRSFRARSGRIMKALAAGLPFTSYQGHLSGIDSRRIDGGFFTHPAYVVHAHRFERLHAIRFDAMPDDEGSPLRKGTLFLDQPLEEILDRGQAALLRGRTIDFVNSLERPIYYKPHYSQKRVVSEHDSWIRLEREVDELPAEWAAPRLGVAAVVSFSSSALVNVAVSDDAVTCYATAADAIPISIDGRQTRLSELYANLGVRITRLLSD